MLKEVYGQFTEGNSDGENQSDEGDNRQEDQPIPITGTDGIGTDGSRERQNADSPNLVSKGEAKSKPTTGTGNNPGNDGLIPNRA